MDAYLDTSALVKLYVREAGTAMVRSEVRRVLRVATSRIAYPEARAAFARRAREGALSPAQLRRVVATLDRDLPAYLIVEIGAHTARRAGDLAERHGLRAYDATHLACALELRDLLGAAPRFLSADARQRRAATQEGLTAVEPT